MNELESPDVLEAAARAIINERCAAAFMHDVRGSMQALFSALELLGKSALAGGGDSPRVARACDLARRAVTHHERSTMDVLQRLTLQAEQPTTVDMLTLATEAVHFLRNEAAGKSVGIKMSNAVSVNVRAERAKLQTLLVGLLTIAIDEAAPGQTVLIDLKDNGEESVISLGLAANAAMTGPQSVPAALSAHPVPFDSRELTLRFARGFLKANGGRLSMDSHSRGVLQLAYPKAAVPAAVSPVGDVDSPRSPPALVDRELR